MTCELILGGARSGKSREAERRAATSALAVTVIATAEALDDEMAARIRRHQDRPPRRLGATVDGAGGAGRRAAVPKPRPSAASSWTASRCGSPTCSPIAHTLPAGAAAEDLPLFRRERDALLAALPSLRGRIIFVANEVGLGLVPETPLGRLFRDEAGRLNQAVAALCPRVVFVAAGLPLVLKQG